MITVWSRLAAACPGIAFKIGQPGGIHSQTQPTVINFSVQTKSSLHTGLMFCKKKVVGGDKGNRAIKPSFKCEDLSKLCPDPCDDDEEVEAIAAHVSGRCEKDPCSKVRDPCEGFVQEHIGKKKKDCKKTDSSNKTTTATKVKPTGK